MSANRKTLPTVDLTAGNAAEQLDRACREFGFFYLVGHGVNPALTDSLTRLSRQFFAQPKEQKLRIHMSKGGRAWRGYFPVGEELTSGTADQKEGIYFGTELDENDPRVQRGVPLHGRNLFPELAGFRRTVLDYMQALTVLGHRLLEVLASGLNLERDYFARRYTSDPTILFRLFNYPARQRASGGWGVGAHTDYGLITFVKQDDVGGLQVRHGDGWIEVPDVADSFVCNVGDMLERLTHGRYLSALHRVKNVSERDRLSMTLFFDPGFEARLAPIDGVGPEGASPHTDVRWDALDPSRIEGTYGEYLLMKVSKVFPQLREAVLH